MTSGKTYEQYEGGIGMRAKKIRIEIRTLDSALREAGESFEKLAGGKRVKGKTALYFSNIAYSGPNRPPIMIESGHPI